LSSIIKPKTSCAFFVSKLPVGSSANRQLGLLINPLY
jgi:hypothetical protein